MTLEWYSGLNNYRKHTLEFGSENTFTIELLDVELHNFNSVQEAFAAHLNGANLPVEVLYSGGIDSEAVLIACKQLNIPATAITLRLMFRGAIFNVHDLYYAEKFCRENQIEHILIDLDVEKFYGNGDHLPYLEPCRISEPGQASIFWLFEQCQRFPVYGGDYTWPQPDAKVYSPARHFINCNDYFMSTRGITGIGNMLSHSLDSNIFFIKEHLTNLPKAKMFENLGFGKIEDRLCWTGWELHPKKDVFHWFPVYEDVVARFGLTKNVIKWNTNLADIINASPGMNSQPVINHKF